MFMYELFLCAILIFFWFEFFMFFRPRNYYYNKNALNAAFGTSCRRVGRGRMLCHSLMEIPPLPTVWKDTQPQSKGLTLVAWLMARELLCKCISGEGGWLRRRKGTAGIEQKWYMIIAAASETNWQAAWDGNRKWHVENVNLLINIYDDGIIISRFNVISNYAHLNAEWTMLEMDVIISAATGMISRPYLVRSFATNIPPDIGLAWQRQRQRQRHNENNNHSKM